MVNYRLLVTESSWAVPCANQTWLAENSPVNGGLNGKIALKWSNGGCSGVPFPSWLLVGTSRIIYIGKNTAVLHFPAQTWTSYGDVRLDMSWLGFQLLQICLPQQIFASHSDNNLFAADYMAMGVLRGSKERRRIYTATNLIHAMVFHTYVWRFGRRTCFYLYRVKWVYNQIGVVWK